MEEKILVTIDTGEIPAAVKAIQDARSSIDKLKKSQEELKKAGEGNSEQFILQEQEIKRLSGVVNENTKILQINSQMNKANEDSLKALKKETSELIKQRDTFSTKTEEGRKKIAELNKRIDENSAIIKENSSAVEQQRANIGNYASALDKVIPGLGSMAANIENMSNNTESADKAGGGFIKTMGGMVKAAMAFILTPLGATIAAIVVGFKLLSTFVTNSTAGMDKFEQITAGVGAALNVLVDRVVKFVSALGSFLSGDIKGGLEGMRDTFSDIGDEMAREVSLAVELKKAVQELEDAEINYEISVSSSANAIKKLINESKNRSLSEEERSKKIQAAMDLEKKQTDDLIVLREEALRIANEEGALRVGLARQANESEAAYAQRLIDTGLLLDEERDKIKDALIARNNAEGQSLAFQEKLQNQLDALAEKAEADREKRAEKEKAAREKREAEIRKAAENEAEAIRQIAEFRLQQEIAAAKTVEDRVAKEIELEKFKREELLKNTELTKSQMQLINEQSEAALTAIKEKGIKDRQALEQAEIERIRANYQGMLDLLIQQAEEELQIEINKEKQRLLNGEISQQEYDAQLQEMEIANLEAIQEIRTIFGEQDLALNGQLTDAKIAQKEYEAQMSAMIEQQKFQQASAIFGQSAALFNKGSLAHKALASAQNVVNTYAAATAALAPPPTGAGPIAGPFFAAIAIATGLKNLAEINKVKLPKFADGGIIPISGKSHAQGGEVVSIGNRPVAEVQGGEDLVVLKRGASPLLQTLATANKLAGGRDFFSNRSPQRYLADGGFVSRQASSQVVNAITKNDFLTLKDSIAALTIVTKVTDIDRVKENKEIASKISELQ